jgi:hypothetical protein
MLYLKHLRQETPGQQRSIRTGLVLRTGNNLPVISSGKIDSRTSRSSRCSSRPITPCSMRTSDGHFSSPAAALPVVTITLRAIGLFGFSGCVIDKEREF